MSGDCVGPAHLPLLPPGTELTFDQAVPRSLVQRRQTAEVFVADSVQATPDDFYLSFRIPRAHALWSDQRAGYHDPLASVEAARQAVSVVLHRHAGVLPGWPVTLRRIAVRIEDPEAYATDGTTPLQGYLHYRISDREGGAATPRAMTLRGRAEINGRLAMTLSVEIGFRSRTGHGSLQSHQRPGKPVGIARRAGLPPLAPALVGRSDPRNAVIAAGGAEPDDGAVHYMLACDPGHPAFSDHADGHIPASLLVEGLRQSAVAAACRTGAMPEPYARAVGCAAVFRESAEAGAELTYLVRVGAQDEDGRIPAEVGVWQFGHPIAEGRIELLPDEPAAPEPPVPYRYSRSRGRAQAHTPTHQEQLNSQK